MRDRFDGSRISGATSRTRCDRCHGRPARLADRERKRIIEERIDALLAEAHHLNFSLDELFKAIRRRQALMAKTPIDKAGSEG